MININIGKAIGLEIDIVKLQAHANVMEHIVAIGLRNILMDSHASCKAEDFKTELDWRECSKAIAEKKLAAMLNGEIRSNGGGVRATKADPVTSEALRMARVVINQAKKANLDKWAKAFDLSNKTIDDEKAIVAEAIRRYAAKPEIMAKAKAMVEAKGELVIDDLDL
jgi:hypothetical protein